MIILKELIKPFLVLFIICTVVGGTYEFALDFGGIKVLAGWLLAKIYPFLRV